MKYCIFLILILVSCSAECGKPAGADGSEFGFERKINLEIYNKDLFSKKIVVLNDTSIYSDFSYYSETIDKRFHDYFAVEYQMHLINSRFNRIEQSYVEIEFESKIKSKFENYKCFISWMDYTFLMNEWSEEEIDELLDGYYEHPRKCLYLIWKNNNGNWNLDKFADTVFTNFKAKDVRRLFPSFKGVCIDTVEEIKIDYKYPPNTQEFYDNIEFKID